MTEWKAGDRCRVVEHDEKTMRPKPDGMARPATVEYASRVIVEARLDDGSLWIFHQGLGWLATDGMFRWRLMPASDEAATAAEGEQAK